MCINVVIRGFIIFHGFDSHYSKKCPWQQQQWQQHQQLTTPTTTKNKTTATMRHIWDRKNNNTAHINNANYNKTSATARTTRPHQSTMEMKTNRNDTYRNKSMGIWLSDSTAKVLIFSMTKWGKFSSSEFLGGIIHLKSLEYIFKTKSKIFL